MKNILLTIVLVLSCSTAFALEGCGEEVEISAQGEDGQFYTNKLSMHTDSVKMRFIIGSDGNITDPKPIEFTSDLYINKAHERIKLMSFSNSGKSCYMDLVLYQVLKE
jgi:hypothetical protein